MKKILIIILLFIFCFANLANAETKYTWIESDDKYGCFIALDTMEIHDDRYDSSYISVWTKTACSYEGALEKSKSFNLSTQDISFYLMHLRFYPSENKIIRDRIIMYSQNGDIVYNDLNEKEFYSFPNSVYSIYMYYLLENITQNFEYKHYKAKDRWLYLHDDERLYTYIDTMTIKNNPSSVEVYTYYKMFNKKDHSSYQEIWVWHEYSKTSLIGKQKMIYLGKNGNPLVYTEDEPIVEELIVPDSIAASEREQVLKYNYKNLGWTNRYNHGIYLSKK